MNAAALTRPKFRGRHNSAEIATMALVVLAETEKGIRCSVDGRRQQGNRDGWLNKSQIEIHPGSEQPFIVVSAPSFMFRVKNLYGAQFELHGEGWTPEQRLAFQWAKSWAHKVAQSRKRMPGRQGNLTSFGRAEYL